MVSFNKAAHLANDTVFIFPSGQLLFASRSILSVQCPRITPLLYSKEGESVLITLTMRFDVVIHSFIPRRIPCYCSNLYRPVG